MQWQHLAHHVNHACPRRLVRCRVGCGLLLSYCERGAHEEGDCRRPCALGCGEVLGPSDRREAHERHLCPRRVVRCRHGCGRAALQERHREAHEAHECPRRPAPCPLGCGAVLEWRRLRAHAQGERGCCAYRLLPCLFDYVGRRVRASLRPAGQRRGEDGTFFEHDYDEAGAERAPPPQDVVVAFVEGYDEASGRHALRLAGSGERPRELLLAEELALCEPLDLDGGWGCALVRACERREHVGTVCPRRRQGCPNGCGQVLPAEAVAAHARGGCTRRAVTCSNAGCGAEMMHCDLWRHENSECGFTKQRCSCGEWLDRVALERHALEECAASRVRCLLGCAQYVARRDMEEHLRAGCAKREVTCALGCGRVMWAEEQPSHAERECECRLVACAQCAGSVPARELAGHRQHACARRPIACDCGAQVPLDELQRHREVLCARRLRWCAMGCGERVADEDMEEHERALCARRIESCRLGCGLDVRFDARAQHERDACVKRPLACPLGCGDELRAEQMDAHRRVCDNRPVPCGANSAACARRLRSWLTGDIYNGAARLVRCEAHGETALAWAAREGDDALIEVLASRVRGTAPAEPTVLLGTLDPAARAALAAKLAALRADTDERAERLRKQAARAARMRVVLAEESALGHTPLTWAAAKGRRSTLAVLAQAGADLEAETSRGRSALVEALREGHVDCVRWLLRAGAAPERRLAKTGLSALDVARRIGNASLLVVVEDMVRFRDDFARLMQMIVLADVAGVNRMLELGEPFTPDRERAVEHELEALERERLAWLSEQDELLAAERAAAPAVAAKAAARDALARQAQRVDDETAAAVAERDKARQRLEPVLSKAGLAVQFVRDRDLRQLRQILEPPPWAEAVMQAACTLLGVEPLEERDPLNAGATVRRFWPAGRAALLAQPARQLKAQLQRLLNGGLVAPDRVAAARGALAGLDQTMDESLLKQDEEDEEALELEPEGKAAEKHEKTSGTSSPMLERDVVLTALRFWALAIEVHDRVFRGEMGALSKVESVLRTKRANLQLDLDVATDALRWAENKALAASEPLREVSALLAAHPARVAAARERLHCARLVSARTPDGHTALSWAAMLGDAQVAQLLLERGCAPDYDDDLRDAAARLIQCLARAFLLKCRRPPWSTAQSQLFLSEDLEQWYARRTAVLQHRALRERCRPPLAHAVYNGHRDVAQLLLNWGAALHRRCASPPMAAPPFCSIVSTATSTSSSSSSRVEELEAASPPAPPPHGRKQQHIEHIDIERTRSRKQQGLDMVRVAELGRARQGAPDWRFGEGWVEAGRHDETLALVKRRWDLHKERQQYRLEAERLRLSRAAAEARVSELNALVGPAVFREDFEAVCLLVAQGASVDWETPEGFTALAYAAWRGTEAVAPDGAQVLAVELLLDNPGSTPNVNRELRTGHTALSLAAKAGRVNVMEALLRRGALPSAVLRDGRTPLAHAAAAGKWDACRVLLGHGAEATRSRPPCAAGAAAGTCARCRRASFRAQRRAPRSRRRRTTSTCPTTRSTSAPSASSSAATAAACRSSGRTSASATWPSSAPRAPRPAPCASSRCPLQRASSTACASACGAASSACAATRASCSTRWPRTTSRTARCARRPAPTAAPPSCPGTCTRSTAACTAPSARSRAATAERP
jgi:ankyrin repeat protein